MDLTGWLRRVARPCPLVVTAPGGTTARLAVEHALRMLGWAEATSPAAADLLVTCGTPGPALAEAIERLWQQLPAPRARVHVPAIPIDPSDPNGREAPSVVTFRAHANTAREQLAAGRARLLDIAGQRPAADVDPAGCPARAAPGGDRGNRGDDHADAQNDPNHGMELPAGLAMADRAEDRDGLKLDQLHVPLGPLLPDWPAGLVVRTAVQGDVVQSAEVEVLDTGRAVTGPRGPFWDEPWLRVQAGVPVARGAAARRLAAAHLDSLARLLGVAGWADAALASRRCRDDLLAGEDTAEVTARFGRLARRVRRSRTLRWLTRGLGVLDPARAAACGVGEDVAARWAAWLDGTAAALREADRDHLVPREAGLVGPRGRVGAGAPPSQRLLELLSELITGTELAAARLIVASLDPDPDKLTTGTSRALPHG